MRRRESGVAHIGQEPRSPGAKSRIAIAGPLLASLGMAGLFGGLWLLDQGMPYLAAPSTRLARINLPLALFNMIPGFPLDGGRVLRTLVRRVTGDFHRATQVAAASGQLAALGFIGLGLFTILSGSFLNGLCLAFVGWFLQNATVSSQSWSNMERSLRGVTVAQVMSRDCPI